MGIYRMFESKNTPLTLNGNHQLVSEGVKALEALNDITLVALFPEDEEISIAEIEIWENMPVRALVQSDFDNQWLTWTGAKWIKETP